VNHIRNVSKFIVTGMVLGLLMGVCSHWYRATCSLFSSAEQSERWWVRSLVLFTGRMLDLRVADMCNAIAVYIAKAAAEPPHSKLGDDDAGFFAF
jgi:hypothetical protein